VSGIFWLQYPACSYRFYIIDEQRGNGYLWFCPKCKHEFRESQSAEDPRALLNRD